MAVFNASFSDRHATPENCQILSLELGSSFEQSPGDLLDQRR